MSRYCFAFCVGLVIIIGTNSGCSPAAKGPAKTFPVKGTVKLDGKAMAGGKIMFEAPGQPGIEMDIKDGAYSGAVNEGKCKVRISQFEAAPAEEKDKPAGLPKNKIPAKYNLETTLEAPVAANDSNSFDFDVTSK